MDGNRQSSPSLSDALAVGLYMGDGSKRGTKTSRPSWAFINSNREYIRLEVQWAVRAGQAPEAFRAVVHAHPEDTIEDEEIISFWSEAGIPAQNIRVYRVRAISSKRRTKRRTPFGTCKVEPVQNGVYLFARYLGQSERIMAT